MLVTALTLLALGAPAPAGAYLYWHRGGQVTRANLDGSEITTEFIQDGRGASNGLAIGGGYIYFGEYGRLVGRARLNGSDVDPNLISIPQPAPIDPSNPTERDASSLAVSGAYVYWTSGTDNIGRANVNGGSVEPGFIELGVPTEGGVAADEGHVYWATEHAIGRARLDGGDVEPDFMSLEGVHLDGIAAADGHIYWTSIVSHNIGRADLQGRHINRHFITALGFVGDPTIGGGYIYWNDEENLFSAGHKWIARAKLNGGDVQNTLINITRYGAGQLAADALGPGSETAPTHRKPRRHGTVRVGRSLALGLSP
jgi:hypothetical protein